MRCFWIRELLVVAIFVTMAFTPRLHAQEYRAKITGTVTDSSKAIIPNATVKIHNLDTGEIITVKTNGAGVYAVPYLHPGDKLEVSATANGFETSTYPPVVLSVSQVQTANFALHVGAASQEVTVTSNSYQVGLDTEKADRGSIIDNKTMTQMPLNGRDVLSLMDYLPGVTNENGAGIENGIVTMGSADAYTVNGTEAGNMDFTIDGMPNNALPWYLEKTPSVVPSVDALQEVKVTTNPYDAEQGHTAAGGVSMELKSGTNQLHGGVWEFARRGYLDANPWINNYYDTPRPGHTEDQYGFEVDGPVLLPKIYNGRNKTFFMFNFEKFKQILPSFLEFDVPDAQWLQGDFSNFVDPSGLLYPVYDPATANAGNAYARTVFQNSAGQPNMVDVSRFNPIALKVLTMVQQAAPPTTVPIPGKSPWEDIWLDTQSSRNASTNFVAKIDQTLGRKDHITGSWIRVYDSFYTPWTPPGAPWFNGSNYREYHANYGLDWVHTISSTLLTDVHVSYQRYWNADGITPTFDPTTLGIPASDLGPLKLGFPEFNISMQQQVFASGGGYGSFIGISRDFYRFPSDTDSIAPKITWLKKEHNIRAGIDLRDSHATNPLQYYNSISYSSDGQSTSELWNQDNSNSNPTAPNGTPLSQLGSGNAVLDMLIGQPNSVNITNEIFPYYTWHYFAPWVQDDWKITRTLTLNLGFRYDFNAPVTVRHGYTQSGFDLNAVNPINSLVSVPGAATLKGGLIYPNTTGSDRAWGWDLTQWQPRVGFAWQARSGTVLRGGAGRTIINSADTPQATGFNYPPVYNNSPDGGRTYFANNMTSPFQDGIPAIPGASQGLLTNVGQGITFDNPHLRMASVVNGSLGLEQAIARSGKFEISYVMSRGYDLTAQSGTHFYNYDINENPSLYKSCNDAQGLTNPNNPYPSLACNTQVSNPFYGVAGVTGGLYDNPTTSAYQLARPYPEFGGITEDLQNLGHSWYNSLQTTYQQRVGWVQVNGSETWSKTMQSGGYANQSHQIYDVKMHSIAPTDRQNRATMTGILYLPVGRGMKYFGHMNRILDGFIGGWELATDAFWESGQPVSLPYGSFNIVGDIHSHAQKLHNTADIMYTNVNPCTEVWNSPYQSVNANGQTVNNPGSYTLEEYGQQVSSCSGGNAVAWQGIAGYGPSTTQLYTDQFRGSDAWQEDVNLSKNLKITPRVNMQLRLESFNVFNHPTWNNQVDMTPTDQTFGMVDKPLSYGQSNNARQAQLGVKVTW